jgi:hypothetical protein
MHAGIDMIYMTHVQYNMSIAFKLGIIHNPSYRFLRLCILFYFSDGRFYCPSEEKKATL